MIGAKRKAERLQYLKNYWMEKVKDLPRVKLLTSLKPEFGCAIGLLQIEGIAPGDLDNFFFQKYRIHTTTMNLGNLKGVRITPNVYTTTRDLDTLVMAIEQAAKKGITS
jgi:selenocysteine lyase/cysteine desulfurase